MAALPAWVASCVADRLSERDPGADVWRRRGAEAGTRAADELGPPLRALLGEDVDAQRATPLQVVRGAVAYPTAVLRAAGVAPARRDRFAEERFPDDPYDLSPATLGALGPGVGELALAWGAAKAMAHRRRHLPPPTGA